MSKAHRKLKRRRRNTWNFLHPKNLPKLLRIEAYTDPTTGLEGTKRFWDDGRMDVDYFQMRFKSVPIPPEIIRILNS